MLGKLVLMGTVTDIGERSGVSEKGPWRIVTAYVAGPRQVYAVTLSDELAKAGVVTVGDDVAWEVYGRIYKERVDWAAVGVWDGELPAPSGSRAA